MEAELLRNIDAEIRSFSRIKQEYIFQMITDFDIEMLIQKETLEQNLSAELDQKVKCSSQ